MMRLVVLVLGLALLPASAWAEEGTSLTAQAKRLFVEQGCCGSHTLF